MLLRLTCLLLFMAFAQAQEAFKLNLHIPYEGDKYSYYIKAYEDKAGLKVTVSQRKNKEAFTVKSYLISKKKKRYLIASSPISIPLRGKPDLIYIFRTGDNSYGINYPRNVLGSDWLWFSFWLDNKKAVHQNQTFTKIYAGEINYERKFGKTIPVGVEKLSIQ